jgi:lipoprotein-anchoring transpeptidase ErfK/SrfK
MLPFALFAVLAFVLSACSSSPKKDSSSSPPPPSSTATQPSSSGSTSSGPVTKVKVSSLEADGATFGVGMPIVLNFSPTPTDSTAFTKAAVVTVNGQPVSGKRYWEKPYADQPVQAHYRTQNYWPAHATIEVKLPIGGLSAGKGLVYDSALTSVTFQTGDAHVSTVNASTLTLTVTNNGQMVKTVPVSLGAAQTPTYNGTKIVMQKGEDVPGTDTLRPNGTVLMSGPGYTGDPVPWSVRVTASGEYIHAAGWNTHIGVRSTSNGCTNLKPEDGQWFYGFAQVGDVVTYVGTDGSKVNPLDGLGDWNVPWGLWAQGGLLLNH